MNKVWVANYLISLPSMFYVHRLLENTHAKQTSLVVHAPPCVNAIRQGYISDKSTG